MKQKIEKLTDTKTHWFEESQQKRKQTTLETKNWNEEIDNPQCRLEGQINKMKITSQCHPPSPTAFLTTP